MYIESIQITAFAGLKGCALDLSDGLNVLQGKNESGKSTVAEFIRFVLYGFDGKADRERFTGFDATSAEGSLILREGDKRYRVERKTAGTKDTCGIYDLDTGSRVFEGERPGEVFFGLPAALFTSTAFVGQVGGSRIDGRSTAEAVDNLLFAADEGINVKKALKRLDEARIALLHKNKKGGRIYELETALSELRGKLAAAKAGSAEILTLESSIADLRRKLDYEEKSFEEQKRQIEDFRILEIRNRAKRLADLEEAYQTAAKEADAHRKAYEKEGFFPDSAYLDSLKSCGNEIARIDARIKEIEGELDKLNRQILKSREDAQNKDCEEGRRKASLTAKRGLALAVSVLCCLLFLGAALATAVAFMTAKESAGTALAVLSVLCLSGMVGGFVFVSRYAAALRDMEHIIGNREDIFRDRLERIGSELTAARSERAGYKKILDDLCGKWNLIPTPKALNELSWVIGEDRRLSEEQEAARRAFITLKSESEERSFGSELEDDGRTIALPEGFDIKKTVRNRDMTDNMIRQKKELLHKNEVRLAELTATAISPSAVSETITAMEYEKEGLEAKYRAYVLAAEKIAAAGSRMRDSVSPRLAAAAGELMGAVTKGKYEELGVDGSLAMTFRPETENGGRTTQGEQYMSAGTADAAYISLRLALISLICGDRRPPVIFDESFARLDDDRLSEMLKRLHQSGGQILLLSSCGREGELLGRLGFPYRAVSLEA